MQAPGKFAEVTVDPEYLSWKDRCTCRYVIRTRQASTCTSSRHLPSCMFDFSIFGTGNAISFSLCVDMVRTVPSNLLLLQEVLSPHTCLRAVRDPVIVSLDLEYIAKPPQITQLGLSILDTAHLADVDVEDARSIASSVSNHLFVIGKKRTIRYSYGRPQQAGSTPLEEILRPFLVIEDKRGRPRNIVLVGHTLYADLLMLKRCGLNLAGFTTIRACFDIAPACSGVFGDSHRLESLSRICWRLGIAPTPITRPLTMRCTLYRRFCCCSVGLRVES